MATLNETQLDLVKQNCIIENSIELSEYSYDKAGRLVGYYNNQNFCIDNDEIQIDMVLDIIKPESLPGRIHIDIKTMWLGDDEFNLTDFKQQQIIKEEIKKEISKILYI